MIIDKCDGQHIELKILPLRMLVLVCFCGITEVLHFFTGDTFFGGTKLQAVTGFNLYKVEAAIKAGNDIHFPVPAAPVSCKDGIAFLLKETGGYIFAQLTG